MFTAVLLRYNLDKKNITYNNINDLKQNFITKGKNKSVFLHKWNDITIIGYKNGMEKYINRNELPPPIDNNLYYGDLILFKMKNRKFVNFTTYDYQLWYHNIFQFENLDDSIIEDELLSDDDDMEDEYDYSDGWLVRD